MNIISNFILSFFIFYQRVGGDLQILTVKNTATFQIISFDVSPKFTPLNRYTLKKHLKIKVTVKSLRI